MRRTSLRGGTGVRVVAAVVAGLLVGGCTGGSDPAPTATPEERATTVAASPTPSPPPRPAVPEQPAAMAEPTAAGAEAAAIHFLELHRYAFMTGDASRMASMSAEGCSYCRLVITDVQDAAAGRMLTDRDPSEVLSSSGTEVRPDEWFTATVRLRQGEIRLLGSDGSVLQTDDTRAVVDFLFTLSWEDGRWYVDAVDLKDAPA